LAGGGAAPNTVRFWVAFDWRHRLAGAFEASKGGRTLYHHLGFLEKPPHYFVYQLLVDIQALTGFPADKLEVRRLLPLASPRKPILAWHDRLCSAGVRNGAILMLQVRSVLPQSEAGLSARRPDAIACGRQLQPLIELTESSILVTLYFISGSVVH
jgi:hypothetical protein